MVSPTTRAPHHRGPREVCLLGVWFAGWVIANTSNMCCIGSLLSMRYSYSTSKKYCTSEKVGYLNGNRILPTGVSV
ncbi:hypothetical protein EDD17DRAFT_1608964 [Pisolithus thermaeus]|nr:hypothetical protein EDD17DRAFT_1608964 [Pisolithus thermaeus]